MAWDPNPQIQSPSMNGVEVEPSYKQKYFFLLLLFFCEHQPTIVSGGYGEVMVVYSVTVFPV